MNKSRLVRVLEAKLEVAGLFMAQAGKQKAHLPGREGVSPLRVRLLLECAPRLALFKEQLLFCEH